MPVRIGLIAMSAKPYHRGHDAIVTVAERDCDVVELFVSLSDRKRPGEVPVLGVDMEKIWRELIIPHVPKNVNVSLLKKQAPIALVWQRLGEAEQSGTDDTFVVYGDETDLAARFSTASLTKYVPRLQRSGLIELQRTARITSATAVRRAIGEGNFAAFEAEMPGWLDAQRAWDILTRSVTESLLRSCVRTLLIQARV